MTTLFSKFINKFSNSKPQNSNFQEWTFENIDQEALTTRNKLKIWVKNNKTGDTKYCTWSGILLDKKVQGLSFESINSINWKNEIDTLLLNWDGTDLSKKLTDQLSNKYWIWKLSNEISSMDSDNIFSTNNNIIQNNDKNSEFQNTLGSPLEKVYYQFLSSWKEIKPTIEEFKDSIICKEYDWWFFHKDPTFQKNYIKNLFPTLDFSNSKIFLEIIKHWNIWKWIWKYDMQKLNNIYSIIFEK